MVQTVTCGLVFFFFSVDSPFYTEVISSCVRAGPIDKIHGANKRSEVDHWTMEELPVPEI